METVDSAYGMKFAEEYRMIGDNELWGGKHAGSDAELAGSARIAAELRALGLSNVEEIPVKCTKYQFNDASVVVEGDESGTVIRPFGLTSPGTAAEGLTAELIDAGTSKKDFYEENDVNGKIVLVEAMGVLEGASPSAQIRQAELRGAAAVLQFATEDLLNDETIRVQAMNHIPKIPIAGISMKDAKHLRKCIREGNTKATLKLDAEYLVDQGVSHAVVGEIPGSTDERIFFSGHLDHYFRCMQDNISSVCTLLMTAKAMKEMGYKPKRTMTFIFNGSHEAGMADSRYPYISGSYKVLAEAKPEWCRKTVADLNFEYSALQTEYFTFFGSYELNRTFDEFMSCFPKEVEGFSRGVIPARRDCYNFLSWADTISYISNGIPTFMNDSLHEQIYELTSPYIGRDHSNHDNMEAFSETALKGWTQYAGAFAVYLDNMPLAPYEFTERIENLALTAEERETLAAAGLSAIVFDDAMKEYKNEADNLSNAIHRYNADNNTEGAVRGNVNELLHDLHKLTVDIFDKIAPWDAITTAHAKHLADMQLLTGAKAELETGNPQSALNDYLIAVDIASWSKHFDKEISEYACDQICGEGHADRRLWARGRELTCLTLNELITGLEKKINAGESDFTQELNLVKEAYASERAHLEKALEDETTGMKQLTDMMRQIQNML